jgi:hypothetical protein
MTSRALPAALLVVVAILRCPAVAVAAPAAPAVADHTLRWQDPSLAVNAGLLQPLGLGGANVEVDFRWRHFVASYSHGWSLDLDGAAITGAMHAQHVTLHIPYTTGFGIGVTVPVRILRSFVDLRAEAKLHRFDASYDSADGTRATAIASYSTYTLGAGAYWTVVPFADRRDALRGLDLSTSFRFWPNVGSTLPGDQVTYANATTGRDEVHHAANIGIANTPIIVNVSIGYVFQ